MIFEESRREVGPDDAYRIVRTLAEYHEPGLVASQPGRQNRFTDLMAELRPLHEGLKRFDWAAFKLRFQTGLEQPIEPADIDLEPAERTRQLIDRLQDDEELGGLARIARHMMAAIHLPRAISDREDLPVGGVSDISNRGPMDRLLLSELAHDDLTLAVRIAMNEALYLRRETPPSNPPKHRAVLLDSGVRLWGVPRVFATAVGMALAAGAQRNVRTDVFRAAGDEVVDVSLGGSGGRGCPHGDAGARRPSRHEPGRVCRDCLGRDRPIGRRDRDQRGRRRRSRFPAVAGRLGTALRAAGHGQSRGPFPPHIAGPAGKQALERSDARPRETAHPARPPPRAAARSGRRPSACRRSSRSGPFRSCFPTSRSILRMAWKAPWGGVLSISKDRCLFHWQQAERGARLVSDRLPAGGLLWTWASALDNYSLAVVGTFQQRRLWVVRVNPAATDCECYALDLQEGRPVAVCGHAGRVFVIYADRVDVFESPRSSGIKSKPIPEGLHWQRDRFFSSSTQWYALGFDGFKPVFEPLLAKTARPQAGKVLAFVDVPGVEGPVGIMDDGCLFLPNQAMEKIVLHGLSIPVRLAGISRSGRRDGDFRQHRQAATAKFPCLTAVSSVPLPARNISSGSVITISGSSSARRPSAIGSRRSSSIPKGGWGWFPANPSR